MPGKPGVMIRHPQCERKNFREVNGWNRVFQTAAQFKIQMTHGTRSDETIGAQIHGLSDDLVYHGGNDIRFAYGQEGAAASAIVWRGDGFGPQRRENPLHQAVIIFFSSPKV